MTEERSVDYRLQAFRIAIDILASSWNPLEGGKKPSSADYFTVYDQVIEKLGLPK